MEKEKSEEKKRVKKKKKAKGITTKSKKKTAIARAVIRKGKGRITLNKINLNLLKPPHLQAFVKEPLEIAEKTGRVFPQEVDIEVSVKGGGFMGQATSARSAIAKALVEFSKDEKLKQAMLKYDRLLLVDDSRRKEAKKPLGKGARKKKQLSRR